ncbi:MAG: cytochrome c oxidase subunit 3 [Burkholderiaceae bacterium]
MSAAMLRLATPDARSLALGVGLWAFIGVASTLFALFLAAYVMRMASGDGVSLALPWQLWLSTSLLVAGSVSMQASGAAARRAQWARARSLWLAGGASALAFLGAQGWAWQTLQAAGVTVAGNPAASFFYLLTAMHGLHVLGGLAAWVVTAPAVARPSTSADSVERIALCARYWHFLLAVWAVLFAAMAGLTPELARLICGVPG